MWKVDLGRIFSSRFTFTHEKRTATILVKISVKKIVKKKKKKSLPLEDIFDTRMHFLIFSVDQDGLTAFWPIMGHKRSVWFFFQESIFHARNQVTPCHRHGSDKFLCNPVNCTFSEASCYVDSKTLFKKILTCYSYLVILKIYFFKSN